MRVISGVPQGVPLGVPLETLPGVPPFFMDFFQEFPPAVPFGQIIPGVPRSSVQPTTTKTANLERKHYRAIFP